MQKPYIHAVINQIKREYFQKISVQAVAKEHFISSMQLQRDFYSATGYSVNEYIRHLRLSNALCRIKASDLSLAEIAYSCGYSSQQALCREIRMLLKTTATEYRQSGDYYFLSPYSAKNPFQIEIIKISIPKTICLKYYSSVLREIENKAVNLFLQGNPGFDGRIFGRNGNQKDCLLCYELYIEDTHGENLNGDGFERAGEFPPYESICACTRVQNHQETVNDAWDYLYSTWLSNSMFEYAGQNNKKYENSYFEEYYYKSTHPYRLKLYLPVTKRAELSKISIESADHLKFLICTAKGFHAEKTASETVIEYLSQNYPYIMKNSKEFYLQHKNDGCSCGVKINTDLSIQNDSLKIISFEKQIFAVLYFHGISDYERANDVINTWSKENNLSVSGRAFAVYDTSESDEYPKMKMLCPVIV